ncbi:uncharacterized protein EI97DRAFT_462067 [Westerdykella ornata]|uniref:Uncharacterized protein n=1 Tax=Westerdykella ornata TaxID=318751 RepID=A0A6A6J6S1_WESOR|nr:uncharacterized protein EI97DRAFT_462067 [Westerdykella ornata]KAF2272280.1 hypothetical protein EI97DRAFT_462067 [Westerdykella ornata]
MGAILSCISCFHDDGSSPGHSFLSATSLADSAPPPNPTSNILSPIQEETPPEAAPATELREMAPPERPKTPHLQPVAPSNAPSTINLADEEE